MEDGGLGQQEWGLRENMGAQPNMGSGGSAGVMFLA